MENVLKDFRGVASWNHDVASHHNMEVIKVEPDFDTESLNESSFHEDPDIDECQDEDPLLINSNVKKEIKEEPCDTATVKEELPEEVTVDECFVYFNSVEHSTNQQWHSVITADTTSLYDNIYVGSLQQGDICRESETAFEECETQINYCDSGSDVELSIQNGKLKRNSKRKRGVFYKCKTCNKSISRKENLVAHNRIHTGEKPFVCEICNKSFIRRDGLVRHTKIHTGNKPFICKVCNKSFIQRGDLIVHIRGHTGEKPFKCKVCSKRFKQSAVLASHSRMHTGDNCYKCDVCSKEFTQHGGLVRHSRSHSGDKPFICDVCNKRFAMRGDLVRHFRIHTRDKPYSYGVCDVNFAQCDDLQLDGSAHTGDNSFSS